MHSNRRVFLMTVAATGAGLAASAARAQAMVDEKDAQAVAVGYVADAARADTKKYPKFAAGQHCGACALYSGKADAASGPCALFGGKQVASKGWCSAFAKKA